MPEEKLTKYEECAVWSSTVEMFGRSITRIMDKGIVSEEDKKELKKLLRVLKTSCRATQEECETFIK